MYIRAIIVNADASAQYDNVSIDQLLCIPKLFQIQILHRIVLARFGTMTQLLETIKHVPNCIVCKGT